MASGGSAGAGPFDSSRNLDPAEKTQAAEHSAPQAVVIHEILRKDGEAELARRAGATFWSGLAAGLSMGFSFLALALIRSGLPDGPSQRLLAGPGYCLGFVIVVLGRQELFTESTLTAVLPLLVRRDRATWLALVRFWAVVLSANILGTVVFARLLAIDGLFPGPVRAALDAIAGEAVAGPFWPTAIKSVFAGWLIALMIWLLPSARSARLLVIMLLTYVVAIGGFSHIIAGSVEAAFAVFGGHASIRDYLVGFFVPTIIGNTLGGVALVALLNHAPLAPELQA
ncbi:formate/nitrite transporter FocA (FNT family) [Roseiarcus fermentans]|uniref:Formate/nitrite transporter FocA (FNT family) n=1 Tax=Roseiarcus fermentans TaxID=1473586 RepID=A0A366FIE8_9HYPH|nr:formate/nitrite transporter family protein [Roseiarcus fermentans]RBP13750.1 formate/nitrite transporter FocA (FNT family) [Roseiarcus fermentans]